MQAILQIFKVGELREGVSQKTGRPYRIQELECGLVDETGAIDQVGVFMLPRELVGSESIKPGYYTASYSLRVDPSTRRISAAITGFTAIPQRSKASSQ